jgi:5'-nucleotidase (lipoprotein e(P4) family)
MRILPDGENSRGPRLQHLAAAALWACTVACATPQAQRTAGVAAAFTPPAALKWFRTAAEREAGYAQAYRYATELINRSAAATAGPWAVVLDADETVLNCSEYQDRITRSGKGFEASTWNAWVQERRAVAFPPARQFIDFVRARGGKVAIVTNRDDSVCEDTRENLREQGIAFDALLCAPASLDDKQPRFDQVASGAVFPDHRPVKVLLFVGDNIQDCPGQTQAQYDPALFGDRCIVLPNPMYGSWTHNEYR